MTVDSHDYLPNCACNLCNFIQLVHCCDYDTPEAMLAFFNVDELYHLYNKSTFFPTRLSKNIAL